MSLLSGKYLQAEQVSPGLVQTFRARDSATGRPVFVHRVGNSDCEEQASLLKLLLCCLYRSPVVKELVLEVKEDAEACYVVTEAAPQCFLLREWLEFEAKTSEGGRSALPDAPSPTPISESQEPPSRTVEEIVLPAPFVSGQQPGPPQAAPIKVIRPLPPEFSPPPLESLSAALAASERGGEEADPVAVAPVRARAAENQAKISLRFDGGGGFSNQPQQRESPQPAVQRPVGVLPLDEFDRLFQEPAEAPPKAAQPVTAPSTRLRPARPVTGSVAPLPQRPVPLASGVFTPILPSAAQTVLESALAAQAASQRNRKLIIGAVAVVLIVLAIVLYLLVGARAQ